MICVILVAGHGALLETEIQVNCTSAVARLAASSRGNIRQAFSDTPPFPSTQIPHKSRAHAGGRFWRLRAPDRHPQSLAAITGGAGRGDHLGLLVGGAQEVGVVLF